VRSAASKNWLSLSRPCRRPAGSRQLPQPALCVARSISPPHLHRAAVPLFPKGRALMGSRRLVTLMTARAVALTCWCKPAPSPTSHPPHRLHRWRVLFSPAAKTLCEPAQLLFHPRDRVRDEQSHSLGYALSGRRAGFLDCEKFASALSRIEPPSGRFVPAGPIPSGSDPKTWPCSDRIFHRASPHP
jgi:hypothetical protein